MQKKNVYLYIQDTLSDWEPGYATAELRSGRYFKNKGDRMTVRTVAATKKPITTMGGLSVTPDATLDEVTADSSAMYMLVGADNWADEAHQPAVEKARELLQAGANVAAICGATGALAAAGLLDERTHTSNAVEYLKMVAPNYHGEKHFVDERAVADSNLITGSSAAPLQWAHLILETLEVFSPDTLKQWYNYFDTGDAKYFFALLQSLPGDR